MINTHPALEGVVEHSYDPEQHKLTLKDITSLPRQIFEIADDIQILDISNNHIDSLPDDFGRLHHLKIFFASYTDFQEVPVALSDCASLMTVGMRACRISNVAEQSLPTSLRALILTDNQIPSLPFSIGSCDNLQKIMLAGNQLRTLPKELLDCQALEIVRFSVSQLPQSPNWLFELPNLAWYGDSSNPYSLSPGESQATAIDWSEIRLGEELGRSVNNIVYYGQLKDGQEVAVKIYGHDLVTDGLPADDMNACLRIGDHQNVIGGIAKVINAPDNQQALVMPLIPDTYKNLGKPPTFLSVCRDAYAVDQHFTPEYTHRVAQTVAAAMRHLHSVGVMHGDLYGHNILTDNSGNSFVGDFGAASLYEPGSAAGLMRERVDVRAFGILLDELLSRTIYVDHTSPASVVKLHQVKSDCMDKIPNQRPTFTNICEVIASEA